MTFPAPGARIPVDGTLRIADANNKLHLIDLLTGDSFVPGTPDSVTENYTQGPIVEEGVAPIGVYNFSYRPNRFMESNKILRINSRNGTPSRLVRQRGVAAQLAVGVDNSNEMAIVAETDAPSGFAIMSSGSAKANFGSPNEPLSPWRGGLGIVISDVLYLIEEILAADKAAITRHGALDGDKKDVSADSVALAAVNATHEWKLYALGERITYSGRISNPGGETNTAPNTSSASGVMTCDANPIEQAVIA